MMNIIIIYLAVSVVVGLTSIARAKNVSRYMKQVCAGDYTCYSEAEHTTGILNLVFLPSILIYAVAALMSEYKNL